MELTFTTPWVYFVIMPLLILFGVILVKKVPFYQNAVTGEEKGRFESLDGLRGFLALNVFFQHAVTAYYYFQTGVWEIVPIPFFRHLGGEAVILFFMITSFLYWSKAISQKGDLDAGGIFRSRFLRLAPMYVFAAGIVVVSILIQSGFNIDLKQTVIDVLSWLTIGLVTTTSVNHIPVSPVNAGIHWTLHFEWFFYLLLPILASALKSRLHFIMVLPIAFFAIASPYRGYWAIFFFGILAAHIYNRYPKVPFFTKSISSLIPILGIVLVYFMSYKPYSVPQYVVSLAVFLAFVYGADLFGLLKTQAAKFLGTISYSLYLIHGIVLFGVLNSVDYFTPIVRLDPLTFWGLITLSGLLTVLISAITYRYIEYPFIKMIKSPKNETPKVTLAEKVM